MGGDGGGGTTSIQDIPPQFKPAYTALYNSAFGAARTAAGQPGFGTYGPGGTPTDVANYITGGGVNPWAPPGSPFTNPYAQAFPQPTQNIWAGPQQVTQQGGGPGVQPSGMANPWNPWAGYQQTGEGAMYPGSPGEGTVGMGSTGRASTQIPLAAGPPIIGQPFPEQFTAGTSPLEFESLAQREAVARQLEGIGNPLLNLGNFTAQGGFLYPKSNPFLGPNIMAALNPITQEFTQSVVPNFSSQAIQSGAFQGSSARDLAFNQLASGYGQQMLDVGTQIAYDNYMQERQFQQQAGALIDQGALLNQLSPELLAQTGLGYRELAQRPLDEALLQYQEAINAPFRPLFPLASIIQGGDIGSAFSTQVPGPSPLSSGIVGALGGAGAGAGLGSMFGLEGGQLAGAGGLGALLGGLGGALG